MLAITGAEQLRARVAAIRARLRDTSPVLMREAARLQALVDASFARNTSPDGAPWAERQQATRRSDGRPARPRRDARPARDLLERTGRMRASIAISVSGPRDLRLDVPVPYAGFQNFGTSRSPAREFLPVDRAGAMRTGAAREWLDGLARAIARYVATGEVR